MKIYAMSDIHGCYQALLAALERVDLEDASNVLVFLGDYVDRGPESLAVIKKIMELQSSNPSQVIALKGNHDVEFVEWVRSRRDAGYAGAWSNIDTDFATTRSFLSAQEWTEVEALLSERRIVDAYQLAAARIAHDHKREISWLDGLPYFHETDRQIFVHAGVLEFDDYSGCVDEMTPLEDGDDYDMDLYWRCGTPPEMFVTMRMQNYGHRFYKDVVAGHTPTSAVTRDDGFHGIAFDGASHYYIDGDCCRSGVIPVLVYDGATGTYSGPGL